MIEDEQGIEGSERGPRPISVLWLRVNPLELFHQLKQLFSKKEED